MKGFDFYQPSRLKFGCGRLAELGELTAPLGKRVLLVIDPGLLKFAAEAVSRVRRSLRDQKLEVSEFTKVQPNPTLTDVQEGAALAREKGVKVVVGFGGGSAMDTARAIAVAATHDGAVMDYLYCSKKQPTKKTLPFVLVTTTSGTGSHMSCCAVVTDEERNFKSALWNRDRLFAQVALVDPELMVTVPANVTASTGFDVFTHAFESFININASPYGDTLALETIRAVKEFLPKALAQPGDIEARSQMAWADTLAGTCVANVGTTLPHAMGQPISGHFPKVSHGQSLAVIYLPFLEYTWRSSIEKFACAARIFNPELTASSDETAAEALRSEVQRFLEIIALASKLDDFRITPGDIDAILEHCMEFPDLKMNPIVPDAETVRKLYMKSFKS